MTALLEIGGRAIEVRLRNLSADGAQIEGLQLPLEGTDLVFRKGELAVGGAIIWTKGRQAGIRFSEALDPATVLNHIPVARLRLTPEFRRPGLAAQPLSARERTLGGHWLVDSPVFDPDRK